MRQMNELLKSGEPSILIQDVSMRDGLQNEEVIIDPGDRARIVDGLVAAGLPRVQIGSFVDPRRVPQMADCAVVWESMTTRDRADFSVLVLNEKGLEQALEAGIPRIETYVSASDTHSRRNSNMSRDEALERVCSLVRHARQQGIRVTAGVMCALGCAFEGEISVDEVRRIVDRLIDLEPEELALADTTGMGTPEKIAEVLKVVPSIMVDNRVTLHLHYAGEVGLATMEKAMELGVRRFDSSLGGLGGCPFVPGARGNLSTEEVVRAAEAHGFSTGVDLHKLSEIRAKLGELVGGRLWAGG